MTSALPFSVLPNHWTVERLDRLFKVVKEDAHVDDEPVSAFIDGVVTLRSNRPDAIIKGSGQEIGYKHLEKNDLVISGMNAHLGGLGISDSSGKCTPVYTILRKTRELNERYISYYLWHAARSGYIKSLVNAVRYNSADFGPETIKSFMVPVPTLEEQSQIADFLDNQIARIVLAFELKRRVYELNESAFMAQLQKLLDPPDDLATQILEGWVTKKIAWLFKTGSGTTPTSEKPEYFEGSIPWVNSGDLNDSIVNESKTNISEEAFAEFSALKMYPSKSLLVAMYGATIGKTGILGMSACVNQAVCVLERTGELTTEFAHYWFLANRKNLIEQSVGGGQPNINQDIIRQQRISFPSLSHQNEIIQKLNVLSEQRNNRAALMRKSLDTLTEYKDSLIASAVTGQLDTTGRKKSA